MPKYWTTKDRQRIAVEEMTDSHLCNAYRMLRRQGFIGVGELEFYLSGPLPGGDGALREWEREFYDLMERPTTDWIDIFEREMARRGIEFGSIADKANEFYELARDE